jgi:hypothetical protein
MKPSPQLVERTTRTDGRGFNRRNTPLLPVPLFAQVEWNRRLRNWVQA